MQRYLRMVVLAAALAAPTGSLAMTPLGFEGGWKEQRFSLFSSNRYGFSAARLTVRSEGAVSLVWRAVPEALWPARRARWEWEVSAGVPATDLTVKGGDDRNLAVYFVCMPEEAARAMGARPNLRALLGAPEARVLVYVWGGDRARGAVLSSPYLDARGRTVVLRGPGTGRFAEAVDLAADHARAFGGPPAALVGLAVSADSDDTASVIAAEMSAITFD